jgi:adenylate cyclase
MLITCYIGVGDEEGALRSARRTLERAEIVLAKDPTNGAALAAGATSLMMLGDSERGKDWIQRALLLDPDNRNVLYNVACGLTFRNSDLEGAIELLDQYFAKVDSAAYVTHAEIDPDMDPLREDPRFVSMIAKAKDRLGMAPA